jgi:hypothetical protein
VIERQLQAGLPPALLGHRRRVQLFSKPVRTRAEISDKLLRSKERERHWVNQKWTTDSIRLPAAADIPRALRSPPGRSALRPYRRTGALDADFQRPYSSDVHIALSAARGRIRIAWNEISRRIASRSPPPHKRSRAGCASEARRPDDASVRPWQRDCRSSPWTRGCR